MKTMTLNLKELNFSADRIKEEAAKNWRLILLYLLFLSGCVSGALHYSNSAEKLTAAAQTVIEKLIENDFLQNLKIISLVCFIPIVICVLSSFSALGLPFILVCPALSGGIVSFLISHLYCVYRVDGVVFSLILLIPSIVIISVMLLVGCNEAVILSGIVASNTFSRQYKGRGELRDYIIRFVVIAVVYAVVIILQAVCIARFGKALLL